MELCSEQHEEICYEGNKYSCPICNLVDEMQGKIDELKKQIEDLEKGD